MKRMHRLLAVLMLMGFGMWLGTAWSPLIEARAEMQPDTPQQHIQSGAQQSVPILREIAATLKQIDARLARMETAAKQGQTPRTGGVK
jgi:hypothetical protein